MGNCYNQENVLLTMNKSSRWAYGLLARLRVAVRAGLVADLDATISNVSPSTPIRGGDQVYAGVGDCEWRRWISMELLSVRPRGIC